MPFSWYHPEPPADASQAGQKAGAMYIDEIQRRAALLMRLGYTKADTKRRIRGNVRWDFELSEDPKHLKQINSIVDKVFTAKGSGMAGPPTI